MPEETIKKKPLFLLDMDGTIYKGSRLFSCTPPFLRAVEERGARVVYLTNNSSKSVGDYVEKLGCMGISACRADVVNSTLVTAEYIKKHHPETLFYALGTRAFVRELSENGVRVCQTDDDKIGGVVMGFDTELRFEKLEMVCRLLKNKLPYLAANPDLCCPTEFGAVPDCGSVAQMLQNATGKTPRFLGKPAPEIIEYALAAVGVTREQALLIGDRMYTDIRGGLNAGVETALVLSGETHREDLARYAYQPDYIFDDLSQLGSLLCL